MRYWTSVARTILTGPAELLWKMIAPIKDNNLVTADPLSLNYNISWSCFQGALSKVNRINQVTKTPNSHVVLSAVAGSLHVMMKVVGLEQLDNMNVMQTRVIKKSLLLLMLKIDLLDKDRVSRSNWKHGSFVTGTHSFADRH